MMRYIYIMLFSLLFSCSQKKNILPQSTGSDSEIVFVAEDSLWKEYKVYIENVFKEPIEGVNRKESVFTIVQINHQEFTKILKRHKNILILRRNTENISVKNKWSKGQLVIQLNTEESQDFFLEKLKKSRRIFESKEIRSIQKALRISSKKEEESKIKEKFNINVIIPSKYTLAKEEENFIWLTYNPSKKEEISNILFFSYNKIIKDEKKLLNIIDSVFSKNIFGSKRDSYVKIDPQYDSYFDNNTCKTLWRLKNGFMGGPLFIKRHFIGNKTIISLGLTFAPNKRKRSYVKTFEAIL